MKCYECGNQRIVTSITEKCLLLLWETRFFTYQFKYEAIKKICKKWNIRYSEKAATTTINNSFE